MSTDVMETATDPIESLANRLFAAGVEAMELCTVYLGVQLGLYRALDGQPATPAELAGALGLAGRSRSPGDPVDRARKAVTMRIRAALRTVEAADPALGRHLHNAIRTGRTCVYQPDTDVVWRS